MLHCRGLNLRESPFGANLALGRAPCCMDTPPSQAGSLAKAGRADALCAWSLGLGVASWLGLFVMTSIPAILCGHRGLARVKASPGLPGRKLALGGLVLGYSSLLVPVVVFGLPFVSATMERDSMRGGFSNARQIALAMQAAFIDSAAGKDPRRGFPADAGLRSATDVKRMLIDGGYLSERDLAYLGFDDFVFGNVSSSDPADTILIKSKPRAGRPSVIVSLGGDGSLASDGSPQIGRPPPRTPAFLE